MPRRWRTGAPVIPGLRVLCVRCGRDAIDDDTLCFLDVLFLARQATNAHEAVSRLDRGLKGPERTAMALAYLEAGHGAHRAPHVGCAFCIRRG